MVKKLFCLLLCGIVLLISANCNAGDEAQHEADLEKILLGRTLTKSQKDPKKQGDTPAVLFGYLEDAIYLCIDQMGTEGQRWLDELNNDYQVEGLPKTIDEISVPVSEHEKYTHMGWDFKNYPLPEKWALRQNILLATVSKVFGFPVEESSAGKDKYSKDCVNMAKLIYYIHILGDHSHNSLASTAERIQLKNTKITRGEIEKGLISDLRECIAELCESQRTSMKYNYLMVKLNVIRFRTFVTGEEAVNEGVKKGSDEYNKNEKKHEKIQTIAQDTINCMQPQLRKLLAEMDFYAVFKTLQAN